MSENKRPHLDEEAVLLLNKGRRGLLRLIFGRTAVIILPGTGEYFDYAWKIMAWMPCRCTCAVAGRRRRGGNKGLSAL